MSIPPEPSSESTPEALAVLYFDELAQGHEPDLEHLAQRLPDDDSRLQLRQLVSDTLKLQGLLPIQVRPGGWLSERYRIVRELGAGGMGKVFEAFDSRLQRTVAIKVLAVFGAERFDPEQLFRKEAVLLAAMQHPNIVAVHEVARDGDVNYLVMDLVDGIPLNKVIERARERLGDDAPRQGELLTRSVGLGVPQGRDSLVEDDWFRTAARVTLEVGRTLEAAHSGGLVHRDVKPQNIMLRGDGSPVLLDFGLAGARDAQSGEVTRGLFGSVAYIAPEQASSGEVGTDPRTDVYQLGTILYELLTLQRAFPGNGVTELLDQISKGTFTPPRARDRGIPFELEAICLQAMELDPSRRYQSMRALREDLERFLRGVELPHAARHGRLSSATRRARYFARRHKLVSLVAATLVVGLAVGWAMSGGDVLPAEDVRPFLLRPPAGSSADEVDWGASKIIEDPEWVEPGDGLAIVLEADAPRFVYVLSAFGERSPPTWLSPMILEPLDIDASEFRQGRARDDIAPVPSESIHAPGMFTVEVPAGRSLLACTTAAPAEDDVSYEGLWVFSSPRRQPALERWLANLDEVGGEDGVSYQRAMELLEQPLPEQTTRGGAPPQIDAQAQKRLAESIASSALLEGQELPFPDTTFFQRSYPVRVSGN